MRERERLKGVVWEGERESEVGGGGRGRSERGEKGKRVKRRETGGGGRGEKEGFESLPCLMGEVISLSI